jgi:hypothetical protein
MKMLEEETAKKPAVEESVAIAAGIDADDVEKQKEYPEDIRLYELAVITIRKELDKVKDERYKSSHTIWFLTTEDIEAFKEDKSKTIRLLEWDARKTIPGNNLKTFLDWLNAFVRKCNQKLKKDKLVLTNHFGSWYDFTNNKATPVHDNGMLELERKN